MTELLNRRRWPRSASQLAWVGLLLACVAPAQAQIAGRLSGQLALDQITAASTALAGPLKAAPGSPLAAVERQLEAMATALRALNGDLGKPVETIGDAARSSVLRAHAAAARVQAYLSISNGCLGMDAKAMQLALAAGVTRLATDAESAKLVPVVDGVESMAHQPLFVLHRGGGAVAFALTGVNLVDTQCADPKVTATDDAGRPLSSQPSISGTAAGRIELRWPEAGTLPLGSVVLHVATQRKAFLVGCTALPPASAVVEVAPAASFQVDYVLTAMCPASASKAATDHSISLARGSMPLLSGYGSTVAQTVDTSACTEPLSYSVSATVRSSDGRRASVGPFTQSAQASITAGLPDGLSLSWNPAAQTLFVRSGGKTCKGVY